jgi:hypothetical protein
VPIIVGTSVMLTFISFWRAAAVVLCDLGSSAFYVGGITEQAIGRSAPWFVLAMLLFAYAVRAVYLEASLMFVRGGVYQLVRTALGEFCLEQAVTVDAIAALDPLERARLLLPSDAMLARYPEVALELYGALPVQQVAGAWVTDRFAYGRAALSWERAGPTLRDACNPGACSPASCARSIEAATRQRVSGRGYSLRSY